MGRSESSGENIWFYAVFAAGSDGYKIGRYWIAVKDAVRVNYLLDWFEQFLGSQNSAGGLA